MQWQRTRPTLDCFEISASILGNCFGGRTRTLMLRRDFAGDCYGRENSPSASYAEEKRGNDVDDDEERHVQIGQLSSS